MMEVKSKYHHIRREDRKKILLLCDDIVCPLRET
jgi:hypothetical protein